MSICYEELPHHRILCIDMKSFYASCSAVMLELDPLECYLAVVGDVEREGSIVLAASPRLKKEFGIKTGSRVFEIPKDPRIKIVNPSMAKYLEVSTNIVKLLNEFVPLEDLHVYSVDECFLKVDGVKKLWGDAWEVAEKIRAEIMARFQLPCSVGIGPNMLLSKLCLDLEGKKDGIAEWTYEDVEKKLWQVSPLSEMWGIGKRTERTLNGVGIFTVGQLAKYPLHLLEKKFGVMGNQLYHHAWGVDLSELGAPIMNGQISFGKSQILMRDYTKIEEIKFVIREMCEEVARRTRNAKKAGRTVTLGIGYSREEFGGGFSHAFTMDEPTNITSDLYKICAKLFDQYYEGKTVRQILISLSNIVSDEIMQLNLFDQKKPQKRKLGYVMDAVRKKYGSTALLWAVSYAEGGTTLSRSKLVGGHKG
ncbi:MULTISPECIES: Y-family DNA polymerase [unclassified Bacillus (in: firmicutes)]|uniref:Y-family DNA polymerase n=1 Tax=Bacillaceae TaxID=186817 RepID=UPI000BF17A07|nr:MULTISPECIES: Y-family DNA polymerase [unclassified Bacillus (in: firmicutes)]PEJ53651.1 UV damage repair protein UvrX [Bacillus sp. AFS002410]PEL11135.1 UV damage repair protein UvrX [Bacillus sp. AFS017336]